MTRDAKDGHVFRNEFSGPLKPVRMRCLVQECGFIALSTREIKDAIFGHFKEHHAHPAEFQKKFATRWPWGYVTISPHVPRAARRNRDRYSKTTSQYKLDHGSRGAKGPPHSKGSLGDQAGGKEKGGKGGNRVAAMGPGRSDWTPISGQEGGQPLQAPKGSNVSRGEKGGKMYNEARIARASEDQSSNEGVALGKMSEQQHSDAKAFWSTSLNQPTG